MGEKNGRKYFVKKPVVQHAEKAKGEIGTFGFCRPKSQMQKTKRTYFLPTFGQTNNETNDIYIEKRDKPKFWAIFAT